MLVVLATACSERSESHPAGSSPTTVGVVLPAGSADSGLPELDITASFAGSAEPGAHVTPLATVLATARARCYDRAAAAPRSSSPALSVDVRSGRVRAVAANPDGACLARNVNGAAIDDPADVHVDLVVRVGTR
jgi:hypothetical protein